MNFQKISLQKGGSEIEDLLIKRITDLARASETQYRYTYSNFLSMSEQDTVLRYLEKEKIKNFFFFGGQDASERKLCVFGNEQDLGYSFESPVHIVKIAPISEKFAEPLSHRDYLGAILNLGIDRNTTGDIIIREKNAWLYCLDKISDYICENLTQVKRNKVRCSPESAGAPELTLKLEAQQLNVASERLDALIAAFIKQSRTNASLLIKSEKVFVNGKNITKDSLSLKDGDIITVRGYGKFIYNGIIRQTKKDRYYISIDRYI